MPYRVVVKRAGAHREILYSFAVEECSAQPHCAPEDATCFVHILQPLPAAVFVDPYELSGRAARQGESSLTSQPDQLVCDSLRLREHNECMLCDMLPTGIDVPQVSGIIDLERYIIASHVACSRHTPPDTNPTIRDNEQKNTCNMDW
jgi:hypothetical protein